MDINTITSIAAFTIVALISAPVIWRTVAHGIYLRRNQQRLEDAVDELLKRLGIEKE